MKLCFLAVAVTFGSQSLAGQNLRLMRGQVSSVAAEALTIRDTLMRPTVCELPPSAPRFSTLGASGGTGDAPPLISGSYVEAIVELTDGHCVVKTLYIRPPAPPIVTTSRTTSFLDNLFPRGNLIYSGTVQAISEDKLDLHTRKGGTTAFTVRRDTVFSTGGRIVTREQLSPQTMVQIRAGRAFTGELEVYQITWGSIVPGQ